MKYSKKWLFQGVHFIFASLKSYIELMKILIFRLIKTKNGELKVPKFRPKLGRKIVAVVVFKVFTQVLVI